MTAGELRRRVERYLALRQSLGFKIRAEQRLLPDFVAFVEKRNRDGSIGAELTLDWVCSASKRCGAGAQARRLSIARGFLSYLSAVEPRTQVPGPGLLPRPVRPTPHIYSEEEITALMAAARLLGPREIGRAHV